MRSLKMEVILIQDVDKIGKSNSVVKVKDGFARNFLFPRNLAMAATPANLKKIEQEKEKITILRKKQREQAESLSKRLDGMSITIPVSTHDEDKLYGSVGASNIIEALKQEGIADIPKEAVILEEQIKATGVYEVMIKLHPEVDVKIKVWVVKNK